MRQVASGKSKLYFKGNKFYFLLSYLNILFSRVSLEKTMQSILKTTTAFEIITCTTVVRSVLQRPEGYRTKEAFTFYWKCVRSKAGKAAGSVIKTHYSFERSGGYCRVAISRSNPWKVHRARFRRHCLASLMKIFRFHAALFFFSHFATLCTRSDVAILCRLHLFGTVLFFLNPTKF